MPKTVLGVKLQTPLVRSQQWHPHQPACQGCYGRRVPSIPLPRAPSASPPGSPTQGAGAGAGTPLRRLWASWCGVRAAVRPPAPAQMREDRGCRSGQGSASSKGTWEACWALLNGHLRRVRTSPLPAPDPGAPTLRPGCRPQGRLISSALGQPGSISIVQPQANPPQQGTWAPPSPAPLQLGGQGLGAALRSHRRVIFIPPKPQNPGLQPPPHPLFCAEGWRAGPLGPTVRRVFLSKDGRALHPPARLHPVQRQTPSERALRQGGGSQSMTPALRGLCPRGTGSFTLEPKGESGQKNRDAAQKRGRDTAEAEGAVLTFNARRPPERVMAAPREELTAQSHGPLLARATLGSPVNRTTVASEQKESFLSWKRCTRTGSFQAQANLSLESPCQAASDHTHK